MVHAGFEQKRRHTTLDGARQQGSDAILRDGPGLGHVLGQTPQDAVVARQDGLNGLGGESERLHLVRSDILGNRTHAKQGVFPQQLAWTAITQGDFPVSVADEDPQSTPSDDVERLLVSSWGERTPPLHGHDGASREHLVTTFVAQISKDHGTLQDLDHPLIMFVHAVCSTARELPGSVIFHTTAIPVKTDYSSHGVAKVRIDPVGAVG